MTDDPNHAADLAAEVAAAMGDGIMLDVTPPGWSTLGQTPKGIGAVIEAIVRVTTKEGDTAIAALIVRRRRIVLRMASSASSAKIDQVREAAIKAGADAIAATKR